MDKQPDEITLCNLEVMLMPNEEIISCRPPQSATRILAFNGKRWFKDDGKPHVGFSYLDDRNIPMALYFSDSEYIQEIVCNKTCKRFRCANGRNGLTIILRDFKGYNIPQAR
jgi:hypothetical protein